jgi:hypothetical protein
MSGIVTDLFDRVDSLVGRANEQTLGQLVAAWRANIPQMSAIRGALSRWLEDYENTDEIKVRARETSTHYVWPLHVSNAGYAVALNEFKDPHSMAVGYATTLHNHRYSFVSLVLAGGYSQVRGDVELLEAGQAQQIVDFPSQTASEGDLITIHYDEFHRLTHINRHTVTLVVKCPAVKDESISVDTKTLRVNRHRPVESRIRQLINELSGRLN